MISYRMNQLFERDQIEWRTSATFNLFRLGKEKSMHPSVGLFLVIIGIVVMIKMVSKTTKRRLDKKIDAPLWARHVWHLVP